MSERMKKKQRCIYCRCVSEKEYKGSHIFECGTVHNFSFIDCWSRSRQCEIIQALKNKIEQLTA